MPQAVAGLRTDPPVSVPMDTGTNPAATATPDPLEEPPGWWVRFHGLRAGGHGKSNEGPPVANSCKAVLPLIMAPAWRSFFTPVAYVLATCSLRNLDCA